LKERGKKGKRGGKKGLLSSCRGGRSKKRRPKKERKRKKNAAFSARGKERKRGFSLVGGREGERDECLLHKEKRKRRCILY